MGFESVRRLGVKKIRVMNAIKRKNTKATSAQTEFLHGGFLDIIVTATELSRINAGESRIFGGSNTKVLLLYRRRKALLHNLHGWVLTEAVQHCITFDFRSFSCAGSRSQH